MSESSQVFFPSEIIAIRVDDYARTIREDPEDERRRIQNFLRVIERNGPSWRRGAEMSRLEIALIS